MNIYTILFGAYLSLRGLSKLLGSIFDEKKEHDDSYVPSRINYYLIRFNKVAAPFAEFGMGLALFVIGIIFIIFGISELGIWDSIKLFISFY